MTSFVRGGIITGTNVLIYSVFSGIVFFLVPNSQGQGFIFDDKIFGTDTSGGLNNLTPTQSVGYLLNFNDDGTFAFAKGSAAVAISWDNTGLVQDDIPKSVQLVDTTYEPWPGQLLAGIPYQLQTPSGTPLKITGTTVGTFKFPPTNLVYISPISLYDPATQCDVTVGTTPEVITVAGLYCTNNYLRQFPACVDNATTHGPISTTLYTDPLWCQNDPYQYCPVGHHCDRTCRSPCTQPCENCVVNPLNQFVCQAQITGSCATATVKQYKWIIIGVVLGVVVLFGVILLFTHLRHKHVTGHPVHAKPKLKSKPKSKPRNET